MDFKDTLSLADNVFTAFGSVCRLGVCMYTVSNSISGLFLKSFMREYRPCQTLARALDTSPEYCIEQMCQISFGTKFFRRSYAKILNNFS